MIPSKKEVVKTILQPTEGSGNHTSVSPSLSEMSARDKPWDKHRANADKTAVYYKDSKEFRKYGDRIDLCSQLLDFKLAPDNSEGVLKLKLSSARFCRVRHCPVCQWRRSLMWKAKAYKILPMIVEKYPKHRWLFVTLTIKNCPITELRNTLSDMNKAWQRFSQRKDFPAIGWIRSIEVTRGKDGSAHPHFHCLLMVTPSYFGRGYLKQSDWVKLWQESMRLDYQPVMDVRAVKSGVSPSDLIPELLKYCVKESDLVADRDWFLELTKQLYKTRAIAVGGVLKEYLKLLEEDPEDYIGQGSDDEEFVDEGHLYFGWKKKEKKYRLID